jgi:uncharacterized protein DUF481
LAGSFKQDAEGDRLMRTQLAGLLLLLGAGVAHAQKIDSVWIRNGDRITGEVESLSRALLEYSTDDLGTIYIEWDKVDRISSPTMFEVYLKSGQKFYGPLGLARPGSVVLGTDTLLLAEIVSMSPIQGRILDRLSGYLDLGFSYQKAHKATQLTTGAKVVYRGPGAETTFDITSFLEDRDDATETSRLATSLMERVLLGNRWSAGLILGYDLNEELDLAGRGRVVGFGARNLIQSNRVTFRATGGLVVTRERYFSTDSSSNGFEGLLGIVFNAFRYDRPKLDASFTSQAFPSFSIEGRVRLQNDLRISYELVKDFMLTLTVFDAYDSKPPAVDAPKNDFGTTLAITWTF